MKLRKRKEPEVVCILSANAAFYPNAGFLGAGWVDHPLPSSPRLFYRFDEWEPVPEDQWENVTDQIQLGRVDGVSVSLFHDGRRIGAVYGDANRRDCSYLPYAFTLHSLYDVLPDRLREALTNCDELTIDAVKLTQILQVRKRRLQPGPTAHNQEAP